MFGRNEELAHLRKCMAGRCCFLFHGPAGVGKTFWLRRVAPQFSGVLYSSQNPTPHALYRHLAGSLLELEHPVLSKLTYVNGRGHS